MSDTRGRCAPDKRRVAFRYHASLTSTTLTFRFLGKRKNGNEVPTNNYLVRYPFDRSLVSSNDRPKLATHKALQGAEKRLLRQVLMIVRRSHRRNIAPMKRKGLRHPTASDVGLQDWNREASGTDRSKHPVSRTSVLGNEPTVSVTHTDKDAPVESVGTVNERKRRGIIGYNIGQTLGEVEEKFPPMIQELIEEFVEGHTSTRYPERKYWYIYFKSEAALSCAWDLAPRNWIAKGGRTGNVPKLRTLGNRCYADEIIEKGPSAATRGSFDRSHSSRSELDTLTTPIGPRSLSSMEHNGIHQQLRSRQSDESSFLFSQDNHSIDATWPPTGNPMSDSRPQDPPEQEKSTTPSAPQAALPLIATQNLSESSLISEYEASEYSTVLSGTSTPRPNTTSTRRRKSKRKNKHKSISSRFKNRLGEVMERSWPGSAQYADQEGSNIQEDVWSLSDASTRPGAPFDPLSDSKVRKGRIPAHTATTFALSKRHRYRRKLATMYNSSSGRNRCQHCLGESISTPWQQSTSINADESLAEQESVTGWSDESTRSDSTIIGSTVRQLRAPDFDYTVRREVFPGNRSMVVETDNSIAQRTPLEEVSDDLISLAEEVTEPVLPATNTMLPHLSTPPAPVYRRNSSLFSNQLPLRSGIISKIHHSCIISNLGQRLSLGVNTPSLLDSDDGYAAADIPEANIRQLNTPQASTPHLLDTDDDLFPVTAQSSPEPPPQEPLPVVKKPTETGEVDLSKLGGSAASKSAPAGYIEVVNSKGPAKGLMASKWAPADIVEGVKSTNPRNDLSLSTWANNTEDAKAKQPKVNSSASNTPEVKSQAQDKGEANGKQEGETEIEIFRRKLEEHRLRLVATRAHRVLFRNALAKNDGGRQEGEKGSAQMEPLERFKMLMERHRVTVHTGEEVIARKSQIVSPAPGQDVTTTTTTSSENAQIAQDTCAAAPVDGEEAWEDEREDDK